MEEVVGNNQIQTAQKEKSKKTRKKDFKRKSVRGKIPKRLEQEMESINRNLTEMQTKFEQKIEGLEKQTKKTKSKKSKKSQKKRSKQKLMILDQNYLHPVTQKLFMQSRYKAQENGSFLPRGAFTPSSNVSYQTQNQDQLRKVLLEEVAGMIDRRLQSREEDLEDRVQQEVKKEIKKMTLILER